MSHETALDLIRRHLDWRNRALDSGPYPTSFEDAAMNRACVTQTINAMELAYQNILEFVPPGTPGKLDAVMKLRQRADDLFVTYANHNIQRNLTEQAL